VGRELEMPFQLPRVRIQGQHAIRVKIIAGPRISVEIRRGLLVPQKSVFNSGSNVPGIQVVPPPSRYAFPGQLSDPRSPGPGMVQNRQASFPDSASYAETNPERRHPRGGPHDQFVLYEQRERSSRH